MLTTIVLDLQITICTFLRPSDILALRRTCKNFQLITKKRIIWIEALHRVCLDNTLFLPSFPIPDMSDVELERAAVAPHRWIRRCAAFAKQHSDHSDTTLRPTTRVIQDSLTSDDSITEIFLVPGGRYLVSYSPGGICVWDLGYTLNDDCKVLASVGPDGGTFSCMVSATSDNMGLIVIGFHRDRDEDCYVYEIFPQSKTPQLTQIANRSFSTRSKRRQAYSLPNKVISYAFYGKSLIFTVWDYRLSHSVCFMADIDLNFRRIPEVIATATTVIVVCGDEIFVWGIPPLSAQPPDAFDHDPIRAPLLFRTTFPDYLGRKNGHYYYWRAISSWYYGSPQPLHFSVSGPDSTIHNFEIVVKPDLSHFSLQAMNTCQIADHSDLFNIFSRLPDRICEDTLVSCWMIKKTEICRVHIRSMTSASGPAGVISPDGSMVVDILGCGTERSGISLCPVSGRFVHWDRNHKVFVVHFF